MVSYVFVEVTLGGKPTSEKVIDIKFHTLNKPIVEDLLIKLERENNNYDCLLSKVMKVDNKPLKVKEILNQFLRVIIL